VLCYQVLVLDQVELEIVQMKRVLDLFRLVNDRLIGQDILKIVNLPQKVIQVLGQVQLLMLDQVFLHKLLIFH